ncbi:MAG TPA: hypothetical protein V6C95_12510 [Coleofasciculaceae cyanobacterium]
MITTNQPSKPPTAQPYNWLILSHTKADFWCAIAQYYNYQDAHDAVELLRRQLPHLEFAIARRLSTTKG